MDNDASLRRWVRPGDGVVVVDHGSRVADSNNALLVIVERFRRTLWHSIVEPAHMELAEPTIEQAVDRCVSAGADRILMVPFFLLPGRHWRRDIPELTKLACERHPGLTYLVTAPLGNSQQVVDALIDRMSACLELASEGGMACEVCRPGPGCWERAAESGN